MYPNTVKKCTINETTIFIVGEHAKHPNSGHLCTDIIATEQPDLVCIESCPERFDFYRGSGHQSTVGSLAAEQYCREHNTELFLLDILQSKASLELQLLPSKEEIEKDRPEFDPSQITENGGIKDKDYLEQFIQKNKEYNKTRFEFIWETREKYMANSLIQKIKSDRYDTVVVIMGLSHIYRFKKQLNTIDINKIKVDKEFITNRTLNLEFKNLLEKRDDTTLYPEL